MTSLADFQHRTSEGLVATSENGCSTKFASELVLIQDRSGRYLSFQWQDACLYSIAPETMVNTLPGEMFAPIDWAAYRDRIQQVLNCLSPDRFSCYIQCAGQTLLFDLVMTPILVPEGIPTAVVVAGHQIPVPIGATVMENGKVLHCGFPSSSERYQKLLTQIASNIRRTLDLPTIWQQTVNGLGGALGVSRCLICPYEGTATKLTVVSEYLQETSSSMLGQDLWLAKDPHLRDAIASLKPVIVQSEPAQNSSQNSSETAGGQDYFSALLVTTCYQDQPNAVILLHQCDHSRQWCYEELALIRELADQVGTAIAHANRFSDSHSLTTELQRANGSLLQKHRELEEARRQAEEASRLKSEFLANTSHELRTPLNGMIGFLKLILDGMADDPEEQNEFIYEAYRSALHLLNIINDVLDIAKIEAGKLQIELSPVKLDDLLSDVEDFTRGQVQQKNLSFEVQKPPTDDEIILFGNYQRLLQVMLNLVGNAIKFTNEGGITISVEITKKRITVQNQELPGMVKVRVADTGIGVSLDKQDKLFQSFSQVDGSRTRQYGGTGLGLAISQKLVEAMGGVVNFYSMGEGLGSTVTFTVPLYQEPVMVSAQFSS
jgi:signal transduction histidine kinase